jgi:hypothetical protein
MNEPIFSVLSAKNGCYNGDAEGSPNDPFYYMGCEYTCSGDQGQWNLSNKCVKVGEVNDCSCPSTPQGVGHLWDGNSIVYGVSAPSCGDTYVVFWGSC